MTVSIIALPEGEGLDTPYVYEFRLYPNCPEGVDHFEWSKYNVTLEYFEQKMWELSNIHIVELYKGVDQTFYKVGINFRSKNWELSDKIIEIRIDRVKKLIKVMQVDTLIQHIRFDKEYEFYEVDEIKKRLG